jgi:hypothetical protein
MIGARGPTGAIGPSGAQGAAGQTGAQGYSTVGPAGPTGPAGPAGPQGAVGVMGAQGPTTIGPTGPVGNTGAAGMQGMSGQTGSRGMVMAGASGGSGSSGPEGAQGPTGPMGPSGPAGIVNGWTPYRDIAFDRGSSDIQVSSQSTISEIARYLGRNPSLQVGLDGNMSSANDGLRDARTGAVRTALMQAGVSDARIQQGAFNDPQFSHDGRVEVLISTR